MGRKRSVVSTWLIALCAACVLVAGLPAQVAGAQAGGGGSGGGFGGGDTGGGSGSSAPPSSDLSITKTLFPGSPTPVTGANTVFKLAVQNLGPDEAAPSGSEPGATVTDQLPTGLSYVDGGGDGWECAANGQTVTCTRATMPTGAPVDLAIEVAVGAAAAPTGAPSMVTNSASVSGLNADPNSANNSSSTTFQVISHTDLSLTKTHSGSLTVGQLGSFTLTVHNNGPGFSTAPVFVEDTLPPGLEPAPIVGDPNGWACVPMTNGHGCTHSAPLPPGDSSFTVGVLVNGDAAPAGVAAQVTNTGLVATQNPDDNPDNNDASDTATVNPRADLQLMKSHSGNFTHGAQGTYTLTVKSLLGAAAGPITVTDTLPVGWSFVAAGSGGNGWSCSAAAGIVTCTHAGNLGNLAQTSFPIVVGVPTDLAANGPVTAVNSASVASSTPDPDHGNNSASDNTTVVDSTPPSLTVPGNITTSNDPGLATAVVTFAATATDNHPGVTVACNPPSGTAFPIGTTTVNCTATDTSGNTDSDSFTVTVNDTQPPSITVPANITVANDPGQASAVVNYPAPVVADNAPGVTSLCSPPSGSTFPLGATTVTCTATDAAGNTATASFIVTVVDTQPPSITVPANITVPAAAGLATAVVAFGATATDNAPGVTVACVPPSGSTFPLGPTTVTCTATDTSGNTATASFIVTVVDTQPPSLTVPANMTVDATSPAGAVVTFTTTAADNAPGVTVTCVPPSGSTVPMGTTTVTCTATDAAGNTASKSFQVKVLGAADQIKNLIKRVDGMSIKLVPRLFLKLRLNTVSLAVKLNAKGLACGELARFLNDVRSARLSAADTAALTADANRIRAVLGC